jgi:hypothetical protein
LEVGFFPQSLLKSLEPFLGEGFGGASFLFIVGRRKGLPSEGFGVGKAFSGLAILTVGHEGFAVLQNLPGGLVTCGSQFGGAAVIGFGEGRARGIKFPVGDIGAAVAEEDKEKRWKKKSAHATVFVGR